MENDFKKMILSLLEEIPNQPKTNCGISIGSKWCRIVVVSRRITVEVFVLYKQSGLLNFCVDKKVQSRKFTNFCMVLRNKLPNRCTVSVGVKFSEILSCNSRLQEKGLIKNLTRKKEGGS